MPIPGPGNHVEYRAPPHLRHVTPTQVNHLNIGLMVASMAAAFALPFEVFLISYAVLGPLHYLTELSWLHDRSYFANHKSECVGLALIALLSVFASGFFPTTTPEMQAWSPEMSVVALGLALMAVLTRNKQVRWISLAVLIGAVAYAHWLNQNLGTRPGPKQFNLYDVIFNIYLTTIIHVFVFTGAFVLYGALRSNSRSGLVSFWVFLSCAVACLVAPSTSAPELSEYTVNAYKMTSEPLLAHLVYHLPFYDPLTHPDEVFKAPAAIQVGRFIAWAYTYHYLNWFSKTSIIKWHEVPRSRFAVVVVIWIGSLVLYTYDYREGLRWLLLLSLLHVFMEFPLNWRSFIGIGGELMARVRRHAS